jgi:hypothetical protein
MNRDTICCTDVWSVDDVESRDAVSWWELMLYLYTALDIQVSRKRELSWRCPHRIKIGISVVK